MKISLKASFKKTSQHHEGIERFFYLRSEQRLVANELVSFPFGA